jgi:intracellular septation protein
MNQLIDLLPVVIFVVAYFTSDIYTATAALMLAVTIQAGLLLLLRKPLSRELKLTFWASLIFGSLTLLLRNELFIQWKPTIVNWLLAAALIGTQVFGRKNLIQQLLGQQLSLVDAVWTRLNFGWAIGFLFGGALNLIVAYNFSMEAWVLYRLFGSFGLTFIYIVITIVYLSRKGFLNEDPRPDAAAEEGRG